MDASLQNTSDPDATYRIKVGKEHRGYSVNITDYQYDVNTVNTRSDVDYLCESFEVAETAEETEAWIADGAYASEELAELAADKNIGLLTTGLRGRKPREILTQFKLSDDDRFVTECPEGYTPRSSSYIRQSNSIRVSFQRCCCENCPHQKECNAKIRSRTAVIIFSLGALDPTEEAIRRKDDETMKLVGRMRNGVENAPSVLRRKYHVDTSRSETG